MTRLVIHIGDCKAGSTALQSVLQAGTFETTDKNLKLLYPEAGRRGALNHHRLSNSLFMAQAKQWQAKAWGALQQELNEAQPDIAIISSERFEFADPNSLKAVLKTHFGDAMPDLHIVAYIRPHLDRVVSGYVQNVKQGLFDGDIDEFLDQMETEKRFHFAPRLARWMAVFDTAQFDIRPMIRTQLRGGCVVDDFLNLCLDPFGQAATVNDIPQSNSSLSAPALHLVRQLWQKIGTGAEIRKSPKAAALNQFIRQLETNDPFAGDKVTLDRATAERAGEIYAEDARACDVKVFGRPVLGPALSTAMTEAPETVHLTNPDDIATAVSEIWLDTLEHMARQRPAPDGRRATSAQWNAARH